MNELLIEKRNFENQKIKLKNFSKNIPSSVNLPNSQTESGLFGLFDHKVTGVQFNYLTNKIQTYLKATNSHVIRIIREFDEVYKTFETLDKEYLNKIIASVTAVEIATNKASKNSNDIRSLIEAQKSTIDKLVQFKDKIESNYQIDDKWNFIKNLKEQIDSIQENFILNKEKIDDQVKLLHQNLESEKDDFTAKLEASSSETIAQINELSRYQKEQDRTLNKEIHLFKESFNEKLILQELIITKQKENISAVLDKLSSDVFTKFNDFEHDQNEKHQNLNKEVHLIKESFNEKLTIQELRITEHKEEISDVLDKLSTDVFTRFNDLELDQIEQHQNLNKEVHLIKEGISKLQNRISIQKEQFSKQIRIVYIVLLITGVITLTHIVLNILKFI